MMHRNLVAFALVAAAIQSAWFCYVVMGPFIFFKTLGLGVSTAVNALINALGLQSTTELGAAIALLSAFAISAALLGMHGRAA